MSEGVVHGLRKPSDHVMALVASSLSNSIVNFSFLLFLHPFGGVFRTRPGRWGRAQSGSTPPPKNGVIPMPLYIGIGMVPSIIDVWGYDTEFCSSSSPSSTNVTQTLK